MNVARSVVEACCANLYGHPLVELVAGQSFHPGGLASTRRLLESARLPPGSRILDAGCGLGASARLAAREFGLVVHACDVSGSAIRRARELGEVATGAVQFTEASILSLPFGSGQFAGALAECVVSTTSKGPALAELRRVMAPGATLLLSDVTASEPVAATEPLASVLCLTGAWGPAELEDLLAASGFEIVSTSDETASISALLDRLEARLELLAMAVRDAGGAFRMGATFLEQLPAGYRSAVNDEGRVEDAFHEARRLVAGGRIGYRAVVARALSAAG